MVPAGRFKELFQSYLDLSNTVQMEAIYVILVSQDLRITQASGVACYLVSCACVRLVVSPINTVVFTILIHTLAPPVGRSNGLE